MIVCQMMTCGMHEKLDMLICTCHRSAYEAPAESSGRGEGLGGMMQRVGSGALSPKAIMGSIAAKGNELLQGRRGPSILNNDVRTPFLQFP